MAGEEEKGRERKKERKTLILFLKGMNERLFSR